MLRNGLTASKMLPTGLWLAACGGIQPFQLLLTLATGAALLQALVVFELHVFSILHRVAMTEKTSLDVDLQVSLMSWPRT